MNADRKLALGISILVEELLVTVGVVFWYHESHSWQQAAIVGVCVTLIGTRAIVREYLK